MADSGGPTPFDATDRRILRILGRTPRAPYADVGAAIGVHERTVARRVERMIATGRVRFTASLITEFLGEGTVVQLAVRCAPGAVHGTAMTLAARADTRSVEVGSGDLLVLVEQVLDRPEELLPLLDGPIGRLPGVRDVQSSVVLRLLLTAADWSPDDPDPTAVRAAAIAGADLPDPPVIDDLDRRMVAALQRDARMSMTRLAAATNVGETTARRRLTRLMGSHVLHLRLFAEPAVLGFPVESRLRIGVEPGQLPGALRRLAAEPSIRYLAVTTGRHNVLAYASHTTVGSMADFTVRALAAVEGLRAVDSAVVARTYKRAGEVVAAGP